MSLDDYFLSMHIRTCAADELHRAIDLINIVGNYDEAIRCLRRCLLSAPPREPFMDIHVSAIIHLGLAHIHKNEYEAAIEDLSRIPCGICLQEQFIPLVRFMSFSKCLIEMPFSLCFCIYWR